MSRIVAIGHEAKLAGYAIVGVEIIDATDPDLVRQAWRQIERDV
jgi:vacuolar-type H+-ATPase subunit F/Vma7